MYKLLKECELNNCNEDTLTKVSLQLLEKTEGDKTSYVNTVDIRVIGKESGEMLMGDSYEVTYSIYEKSLKAFTNSVNNFVLQLTYR